MNAPRWIPREAALAVHAEVIAEHGGLPGIRDEAALDASLARARNKFGYEGAGLALRAAAYGFALARNHPFNDGNERVALACVDVFLRLNGRELVAKEVDAVSTIVSLAAGEITEAGLAGWIERNSAPRT